MRAGRLAALAVCGSIALAGCLTACAPEETVAEAKPGETMRGPLVSNESGATPAPANVPTYPAGEDAIAALIPAE